MIEQGTIKRILVIGQGYRNSESNAPKFLFLAHGVEPLDVLLALLDDLVALQHAVVFGVLVLVVVLHHGVTRALALGAAPRGEQRGRAAGQHLGRADQLLAHLTYPQSHSFVSGLEYHNLN